MNLLSLDFSLYFTAFFILYWSCRSFVNLQNYLLIIVSYLFIAAFSTSSAIILFIYSLCIYWLGLLADELNKMNKAQKPVYKGLIILVVAFFITFKYYTPSRESLSEFLNQLGLAFDMPILDILVPLGLSFYIFHSVSYVVSVSKKEITVSPFVDLLLFLSFFPSIVSGPINRAKIFLPQIARQQPRELTNVNWAFALIAWAIAKLFLGSGYLEEYYVKGAFSVPDAFEPIEVLIGIYSYAWQIYFNFSGYTSLVTGIALLLGFELPKNFNSPYIAQNLQEFWKRWHISLSTFIRDYVYIPLGGSRIGFTMQNFNLMIAMVLSGIWHGAGINFVLWGFLHGIGLIFFNLYKKFALPFLYNKRILYEKDELEKNNSDISQLIPRLLTFHYVCFAWIFFRCVNFSTAVIMLESLSELSFASFFTADALLAWAFILILVIYPSWCKVKSKIFVGIQMIPWHLYPIVLVVFLTLVFVFSPNGVPGFIYANF